MLRIVQQYYVLCGADQDWDHATFCEKNTENREELMKVLEKKLKEVDQNGHAKEEEK